MPPSKLRREAMIQLGQSDTVDFARKKSKKKAPECKNSTECSIGGKNYCIPDGRICGGKKKKKITSPRGLAAVKELDKINKSQQNSGFAAKITSKQEERIKALEKTKREYDDLLKDGKIGEYQHKVMTQNLDKSINEAKQKGSQETEERQYKIDKELSGIAESMGVSELALKEGRVPPIVKDKLSVMFDMVIEERGKQGKKANQNVKEADQKKQDKEIEAAKKNRQDIEERFKAGLIGKYQRDVLIKSLDEKINKTSPPSPDQKQKTPQQRKIEEQIQGLENSKKAYDNQLKSGQIGEYQYKRMIEGIDSKIKTLKEESEKAPETEPLKPTTEQQKSKSTPSATLTPKPFNPHAIPDLSIKDFAAFIKVNKSQDLTSLSPVERQKYEQIKKAISYPLVSDEEASGFKPKMTQEEADAYTAGSVTGGLKFYHGNSQDVIKSMEDEGVQPDRNKRGLFGTGAYFGASKEIGQLYQSVAHFTGNESSGMVEIQAKVKNPIALNSGEYAKIERQLKEKGDAWDSEYASSIQSLFRAQGYDSIYLQDKGYFVTFDSRQTVVTNVGYADSASKEEKALSEAYSSWSSTPPDFKASPTGGALADLTTSSLRE